MDPKVEVKILKNYAVKLEFLCRQYMSKSTVDVNLHNLWLASVHEALEGVSEDSEKHDEDIQQEIKDGYNE